MHDIQTESGAQSVAAAWTPVVILDGGVHDGIEVGRRFPLAPQATRAEAMAAAKAAMLAAVSAIGFTAKPVRLQA